MARLGIDAFTNFFRYYQDLPHQRLAIAELWKRMPVSLLEEDADWIQTWRDPAIEEDPKVSVCISGGESDNSWGGVLAAAIGAAAVLYLQPQGWNGNSDAVAAQSDRITALQGGLDALRAEIAGDRAATIAALQDEVAALATSVAQLDARVATAGGELDDTVGTLRDKLALVQETQDTLTGRVGALEARPVDQAPDIAALQADVRALTARLETAAQDARDQILAANERAAEVEKLAVDSVANQATQSTLTALGDALASGRAYDNALGAFQAAAPDAVIDPALADNAANGVASLRALRADFPDAARAVLADVATAAAENATMTDRMFAFFRAQTGARSLSPREGDDADAVLSRAEAALGDGDLAEAVRELRALPPEVADPMQGWLLRAQTRLDVMSALNDLSAPKTSN